MKKKLKYIAILITIIIGGIVILEQIEPNPKAIKLNTMDIISLKIN